MWYQPQSPVHVVDVQLQCVMSVCSVLPRQKNTFCARKYTSDFEQFSSCSAKPD